MTSFTKQSKLRASTSENSRAQGAWSAQGDRHHEERCDERIEAAMIQLEWCALSFRSTVFFERGKPSVGRCRPSPTGPGESPTVIPDRASCGNSSRIHWR